jgi:hypothetical protein
MICDCYLLNPGDSSLRSGMTVSPLMGMGKKRRFLNQTLQQNCTRFFAPPGAGVNKEPELNEVKINGTNKYLSTTGEIPR